MAIDHYLHAQKKAQKLTHTLQSKGEDATLPVLSEIVPELNRLTQVPLGLIQIPLNHIEGTATRGRTTAFARNFMPLLESSSEFAYKWYTLYDDVIANGLREPIIAFEYYNRYYVVEGNKRVSVMRTLDAVSIEAHVTRVLPEPEDSERYRVYQEFLKFYADCKINFIDFTREGSYTRLYAALGKTPGDPWSSEEVTDLHSCYHRFEQAYGHPKNPLSTADAFLKYIEMFGYAETIPPAPAVLPRL